MHGWVFPGHYSKFAPIYLLSGENFKIFIHQAKPILQTFFCTTIFRRAFCTKIFNLMGVWICMVGCFQVTPQNFLLFDTFKGIFSNFSYVKPNPYYSLFCGLGVLCYQYFINSWRCYSHFTVVPSQPIMEILPIANSHYTLSGF